jgi:hypothetical protein
VQSQATPSFAPPSAPQKSNAILSNDFREQIIRVLEIPGHLTTRTDATLQVAYARWKAHAEADLKLSEMWTAGTWEGAKPSAAQLAEVFISKSNWFQFYCPAFSKISKFPIMIDWLEDAPDAETSVDVWGFHKNRYGFKDLIEYVKRGGPLEEEEVEYEEEEEKPKKSKGKRKAKEEKGSEKGSEKKKGRKLTRIRRSS